MSLLKEHHLEYGWHFKKYLKDLILKHIQNVEFVKSVSPNEAETFTLSRSVMQAVANYTRDHEDPILAALIDVSRALRLEILDGKAWKFTGDLGSFENPPMLQVFLKQLLFGPVTIVGERREKEEKKTVDVVCQLLIQNTHTDRQVKLKTKGNRGFRRKTETPLSIGLPLTIHARVRDKSLVTALSSVFLDTGYANVLNIEKRIEHGVLLRMQNTPGGITACLPDWLKRGVGLTFAVDNIGMLEDTAYGQNTFHGVIVVLNQRKDEYAESIQEALIIPDKAPVKPLQVEIHNLEEPVIVKKPIRFDTFTFGRRKCLLKPYQHYNNTWVLANYLGNKTSDCPSPLDGDSSSPVADVSPSPSDASHPPTDAAARPADASNPPSDAAAPPADASHTRTDAAAPPADASHPRTDAAAPPADASHPRTDAAAPPADASHPRTDAAAPADASHPRTDAAAPPADASHHRTDAAAPPADASHPRTDAAAPPADASHPPTDAAAPPADVSQHPSDALPPSSDDNSGTYPDGCSSSEAEITDPVTSILSVKIRKNNKVNKKDVMPTWAATKSLLLTYQEATSNPMMMNSEVLAPLFKTPPTDFATLYTALRLTQNILALVVGPERRTVIELDLDLYCRAVHIQQSVKNKNWIIKAGTLHICFAALHALGKTVEGSGMDTEAVETGVYSSAALRSIYGGTSFKRGVAYHTMMSVAIMMMEFESLLVDLPLGSVRLQCRQLMEALHLRDPDMVNIYEDLEAYCTVHIDEKHNEGAGELAIFFNQYLKQVEALLMIIAASRQGDWLAYLAALDNQIKYFFAADLINYARFMPLHLAQMNQLETDDPLTWEALKSGAFVVSKSDVPFTSLFTDQNLEQKIKGLKGHGGFVGLTQDGGSLDRLVHTTPFLSRIVRNFLSSFPSSSTSSTGLHYQLSGDDAVRSSRNALKIRDCMKLHCQGNPHVNGTPLKNIVSSALIPEAVKPDILRYPEKGQAAHEAFVADRLMTGSHQSIWDPMKKMKLKNFSNWTQKTKVKFGDKVIKLREDRQFLGRCLIIQESRPELVPRLADMIGNYELSVVPRSIFAADGTLLLPTDKASVIHAVEAAKLPQLAEAHAQSTSVARVAASSVTSDERETTDRAPRVLVIDAMAVVQCIKKTPSMTTILHLKTAFNARIERMAIGYMEVRVIFDRYVEGSLKEKTRKKRATSVADATAGHVVHDGMSINTISLKQLLSCTSTKHSLTCYLGKGLLEWFDGRDLTLVVVYDTVAKPVNPPRPIETHSHEEADTLIPLHVILSIEECTYREVDVWSPDTDVLVLLMDLVSRGHLGALTKLKLLTGKGAKHREIDICERVKAVGMHKSRALLGFHHFTGADWGGKFVGLSKKTWMTAFLSLDDNDPHR